MEASAPLFVINLLGITFNITKPLVIQWVIILATLILSVAYSKTVRKIPGKIQCVVEMVIEFLRKVIDENMGEGKRAFLPYIGSLGIYLFLLNMTALFGFKPPTAEFSVSFGIGITSFFVIQAYAIKKHGVGGYFKGYASPVAVLLPINILDRVILPISLALRLFGNVFAASMIMELLYEALLEFSFVAAIGLPVPFHFYFDLFDGSIQMVIFVMLTMINIKITSEH